MSAASNNPYGLTDIGWCRLAALVYGLQLINEKHAEIGVTENFNGYVTECYNRFDFGPHLVRFVITKGDQIHHAWKTTEPDPPPKPTIRRKPRIPHQRVAAMYADYRLPMSLSAVARKYNRSRRALAEMFHRRNLPLRSYDRRNGYNPKNGCFLPLTPKTHNELQRIIARATKLKIPRCIYGEWRHWSRARRGRFVAQLREKLNHPEDRPRTPFSSNVTPFDYGSDKAHRIMNRMNAGLDSRHARIKIDLCTQGVIYKGQLWFWRYKTGYQRGPWNAIDGRPTLNRVIWEQHNGCKVPPKHQVYFRDGNQNNLDPSNLALRSKRECLAINSAAFRLKRGLRPISPIPVGRLCQTPAIAA